MNKKQIDEKQLLTDAMRWFEKKHGVLPDDCNMEFFKIWRKPTIVPFVKKHAIVFAPTEEVGKAFIWEQNAILRTMKNFIFIIIFCIASIFTLFSQIDHPEKVITIAGIDIGLLTCAILFFEYLSMRCKKCEKIHQWNVEVYHSGF